MIIRRAKIGDIEKILDLLKQVLDIHAQKRPDIFKENSTKYSRKELEKMIEDDNNPIYVADDNGVIGYAFCQIKHQPETAVMKPIKYMYIDDLCVDENCRGKKVGRKIFEYVKDDAKKKECYEITLNVWEGNDTAKSFYSSMEMRPKKYSMEYIL